MRDLNLQAPNHRPDGFLNSKIPATKFHASSLFKVWVIASLGPARPVARDFSEGNRRLERHLKIGVPL
jgi:hypothetical protein